MTTRFIIISVKATKYRRRKKEAVIHFEGQSSPSSNSSDGFSISGSEPPTNRNTKNIQKGGKSRRQSRRTTRKTKPQLEVEMVEKAEGGGGKNLQPKGGKPHQKDLVLI